MEQDEKLWSCVMKASHLVLDANNHHTDNSAWMRNQSSKSSPSKYISSSFERSISEDQVQQQQEWKYESERLTNQLMNSLVFMDDVYAECFSWNQSSRSQHQLTSNQILKLGAISILNINKENQWISEERFQQLLEMNYHYNLYISKNSGHHHVEVVDKSLTKVTSGTKSSSTQKESIVHEEEEFEKIFSDDEDEEEEQPVQIPTSKTTSQILNASNTTPSSPYVVISDQLPQHNTGVIGNVNLRKAVFFVSDLSKALEKVVKKAIDIYKFTQVYFYCAFSEGFCEYYQSTVLESMHQEQQCFPRVRFVKDYLTYSDLIEKTRLFIFDKQFSLQKKDSKLRLKEDEINNIIHVEVTHYPFNISLLLPDIFMSPTCVDVFPIVSITRKAQPSSTLSKSNSLLSGFHLGSSPQKEKDSSIVMQFKDLPPLLQLQYKKLSVTLRDMLKNLRMSVDVYSLGQTSNLIAEDLQSLIGEESFKTTDSCTLVIMDRTLDLVSPMVHSENILDKIVCSLERSSKVSSNVKDPTPLFLNTSHSFLKDVNLSGILHHGNEKIVDLIRSTIEKKPSETISEMKILLDKLQNVASKKSDMSLDKTISSLKNLLQRLNPPMMVQNGEIIQFLSTILHSLELIHNNTKYSELSSTEKLILYECDTNQEELLKNIVDILKKNKTKFTTQEILRLVIMIYSVVSPNCTLSYEHELKNLLVDRIIEEYKQNHSNNLSVEF
ncbi:hypothetical protein C9374_006794 [Naegleria lovaniensis]|uniref:Uncharacterized protein n=1 Tax=Naegleria lovaniensis TaxID=51637 RepID=A0AA88KPK5_NAELO|nr:uncharacterized protein C9374_006794 [Naegleria lovaniensis]KAG2393263.1 hypothetical protein C9374_006794 [Naegleria lovaniensis]